MNPFMVSKPVSRIIFDTYDIDHSGSISLNEFQQMLKDHGIFLSQSGIELSFSEFDLDASKQISYEEFLQWKKKSSFENLNIDDETLERRTKFLDIFKSYDINNDGKLSMKEFEGLYEELKAVELITKTPLNRILAEMDENQDGSIELNELVKWVDAKFRSLGYIE